MKYFSLSFAGFLILLGSVFINPAFLSAQVNSSIPPSFSCGPFLETYVVSSPDFAYGSGIRCVKWSDGASSNKRVPAFAWYGEGRWDEIRYRHVGQAFKSAEQNGINIYQGFATDMHGNGETVEGDYRGGLVMTVLDRDTIQVSHGWNETWKRVPVASYEPLPLPTTCGQYFDQYTAVSIPDYTATIRQKTRQFPHGQGMRCVMRTGAPNTTWLGFGQWNGKSYMHLVTGSNKGYGSSDFCRTSQDYCGSAPYGGIRKRVSSQWKKPTVDGWNEIWIRRGTR